MTEITYYSILKNNQLCLPWSDDDRPAQLKLQDDKEAQLAALVGQEMPVDKLFNTGVITIYTQDLLENFINKANYKFNPNKPGIFQWQSVDDVFLMVVD